MGGYPLDIIEFRSISPDFVLIDIGFVITATDGYRIVTFNGIV